METEKLSETLETRYILTRLVTRKDFTAFSRHESFKSDMGVFY